MASRRHPRLYVIAGPNGAGKTTFARRFLPHYADCDLFVNADLIAAGLSPFNPEIAAIKAGRLMLEQIDFLAELRRDFAIETTLSGKTYLRLLQRLKDDGYRITMYFLWLESAEIAIERVARRVARGGHHIPDAVVRRRYGRGVANLLKCYRPLVDDWAIWNNSNDSPKLVAKGNADSVRVVDPAVFHLIMQAKEEV